MGPIRRAMSLRCLIAAALLSVALAAPLTPALRAPHKCTSSQPVAAYKVNDATWCETFCISEKLVKTVEQFGDVLNGTCTSHAFTDYDHSLSYNLYGENITVDMFKKAQQNEPEFPPPPTTTCCACVKGTDQGSDLFLFSGEGQDCEKCCEFKKGYQTGKAEPEQTCSAGRYPVAKSKCAK